MGTYVFFYLAVCFRHWRKENQNYQKQNHVVSEPFNSLFAGRSFADDVLLENNFDSKESEEKMILTRLRSSALTAQSSILKKLCAPQVVAASAAGRWWVSLEKNSRAEVCDVLALGKGL